MSERENPTHGSTPDHLHWTTVNVGEGLPGVLSPLTWTTVGPSIDAAIREAAFAIGVLSRRERDATEPPGAGVFYGRVVMGMELIATLGDRLPATSGREVLVSLLGAAPDTLDYRPTKRRYPMVAAKFLPVFLRGPREMRAMADSYTAWWTHWTARLDALDEQQARALLADAVEKTRASHQMQGIGALVVVQPVHDAFTRLIEQLGHPELAELAGVAGGPEMELVRDLWAASRDTLTLEDVIGRHGYHGPREGELSSRSWREEPAPLRRALDHYRSRDDDQAPDLEHQRRAARHREILDRARTELSPPQRVALKVVLALARRRLPLRGVVKIAMVQSLDMTRGAARRLGEHLQARDVIDTVDDVFFLTAGELTATPPPDTRELVAARRATHADYSELTIPEAFRGTPTPIRHAPDDDQPRPDTLSGIGVSPGTIEGTVRVIADPAADDIEPDEILVAPYTDPSWASIMFVSNGLIVEIGGALSHAAVVAREMGIPCVVNLAGATQALTTGDRIRLDGSTGTVEVLERA